MTSSFNALLSDIYRILSLYEADDFVQASRSRRVDPLLRDALRALARPAREGRAAKDRVQSEPRVQPSNGDHSEMHPDMFPVIVKVIADTSADRVVEIFSRNGVRVEKRPKESKDRFAKRLTAMANMVGSSRRRRLLEDLTEASGSQTAGWINVLRPRS